MKKHGAYSRKSGYYIDETSCVGNEEEAIFYRAYSWRHLFRFNVMMETDTGNAEVIHDSERSYKTLEEAFSAAKEIAIEKCKIFGIEVIYGKDTESQDSHCWAI